MQSSGLESLVLVGDIAKGDTLPKHQSAMVAFTAKRSERETQQEADLRVAAAVMQICMRLFKTLGRIITPVPLASIPSPEHQFELM